MVWEYCESFPLSVYSAVLDLYSAVSTSQLHKRPPVPLIKAKSWVRGGQLEYDDAPDNPIIRLTIDSRRLRSIEGLSKRPSGSKSGSNLNEFVVEAAERFSGVLVEFQLSLARLQLPAGETGFYILDAPCPPPLERCFGDLSDLPRPCHLGTVQLRACTGIAFFHSWGSIYAVHTHSTTILPLRALSKHFQPHGSKWFPGYIFPSIARS